LKLCWWRCVACWDGALRRAPRMSDCAQIRATLSFSTSPD